MGCSLWGFGGPTNRQNKKKTHQNCMLASKTREKTRKNRFRTWQNILFQNPSWWIFIRHTISTRLQWEENVFENIFFLREFSSAAPTYLVLSSTLLSWVLGLSHLWSSAYHAQDIIILSSLQQYFTLGLWPSEDCLRYRIPPTEYLSTFHIMSSSTRWRIFSRETKLFRIDFPSDKRSQAHRWNTPSFSFLKKMILVTLGGSDMLEHIFLTDGYLHCLFCTPSLKAARPYGWTWSTMVHHGIFHLYFLIHSEIGWALFLFA